MAVDVRDELRRSITPPYVLPRSHLVWLGSGLVVGALVGVSYLLTHPYPAYGAGLYLEIAEQIRVHGYRLPPRIPHYTDGGIPFAYPPLLFYVTALILDSTGIGAITYARVVPVIFTVVYLVPYYYAARELLGSRPKAGVATIILATAPPALQWHLSAGGIIRAGAFLLAITGIYTGTKLFSNGERMWIVPSAILFGLTILSHPVYALFFATTYLVLYLVLDHSIKGFLSGAVVALGGVLIALPWILHVGQLHGFDVFTAAAGTHSGIGGGFQVEQVRSALDADPKIILYAIGILGGVYLFYKRRPLLPVWVVVLVYVVGKGRFYVLPGAMMAAILLLDVIAPRLRHQSLRGRHVGPVLAAGAIMFVALAAGTGLLFATGTLQTHGSTATQPSFMDDADRDAMVWVRQNVDSGADFVVLGDAAEWFPLLAERTILLGPWGVEWVSSEAYWQQLTRYRALSHCETATCITRGLAEAGVSPDYVYVPTGRYTVRGFVRHQASGMKASLHLSDRYRLVFQNEGVLVFEVLEESSPPASALLPRYPLAADC